MAQERPTMSPFHLAMPCQDLEATRTFYTHVLGCVEGRSAARWVDFNFFGHQLSFHLAAGPIEQTHNAVDGEAVPVPHFGVILPWEQWHRLARRLEATDLAFIIAPRVRFRGQVGEQATMFFQDPSGNALEFKSFQDEAQVFSRASLG